MFISLSPHQTCSQFSAFPILVFLLRFKVIYCHSTMHKHVTSTQLYSWSYKGTFQNPVKTKLLVSEFWISGNHSFTVWCKQHVSKNNQTMNYTLQLNFLKQISKPLTFVLTHKTSTIQKTPPLETSEGTSINNINFAIRRTITCLRF